MDFRSLLQSMTELSESEGSRVHKGTYGTSHGKEDVRDQYGHRVGKVDKEAGAKKDAPKKGRGRPKKGADDSGEVKQYDTKTLGSVFGGGQKPKGEVGKKSVKHSLKEYIEEVQDQTQLDEAFGAQQPIQVKPASQTNTQVIQRGNQTLGTVNNPQLAAQIKQSIGKGEMTLNPDEQMAEEDEGKPGKNFAKIAKSAGAHYGSKAAGERVAGAVRNKLAAQGKLEESEGQKYSVVKNGKVTKSFDSVAKAKDYAAKFGGTIKDNNKKIEEAAKPDFLDVDKDDNKKESWKKAEKDKAKKKVAEGRVHEDSDYTYETVGRILAREKPGMDSSSDDFYSAVYHELIQLGMTPKSANSLLNYNEDFMGDTATAYEHYQSKPGLDEGSIEDHTQHGLDATPSKYVAVPAKQEPTPFSVDPIQATTDRAINFISGLRKPSNPFSESTDMKDIQLESWENQLNSLLTEGITVSSSTGQQGSPDSVTISATDADAGQLLGVLRNAGIGVFGGDEKPQIGYGVAQGGEEEFDGTGTEPQAAPEVVGDGDDMLALMKKMAGIEDGGQEQGGQEQGGQEQPGTLEPTQGGDEEGQDYEDEETSGDTSSDEESADEGDDEEEVDEANDGNLANNAKPYDKVTQGDVVAGRLGKDEEGGHSEHDHEDTCESCGQASCECDEGKVEESFANEPHDEIAQLKALLSMGNDLNRQKNSQAVGNPVRAEISDWKKLSGI
jgi:hypothetical protein